MYLFLPRESFQYLKYENTCKFPYGKYLQILCCRKNGKYFQRFDQNMPKFIVLRQNLIKIVETTCEKITVLRFLGAYIILSEILPNFKLLKKRIIFPDIYKIFAKFIV